MHKLNWVLCEQSTATHLIEYEEQNHTLIEETDQRYVSYRKYYLD